jgi:uncharacterized protein YkwD
LTPELLFLETLIINKKNMEENKKSFFIALLGVFFVSLLLLLLSVLYNTKNILKNAVEEERIEIENAEKIKVETPVDEAKRSYYQKINKIEDDLLALTNKERVFKLKNNDCLKMRARERAEQIVSSGEFSHYYNGETPYKNLIKSCFNWTHVGENLAKNFETTELMHAGLMNSPTHRMNILGDFKQAGFGCYENVCVQFFSN